ncbi:hypothetical protein LDENG_00096370 [Lucifuga dentata]|nr:hypothetical protein LDENG_00096370 [Lucifuga dentata]
MRHGGNFLCTKDHWPEVGDQNLATTPKPRMCSRAIVRKEEKDALSTVTPTLTTPDESQNEKRCYAYQGNHS